MRWTSGTPAETGRDGPLAVGVWTVARLALYLGLLVAAWRVFALLAPGGLVWGGLVALAAGLVSGWVMLALDGRRPQALGFHLGRSAAPESARGLAFGVGVALVAVALIAGAGALAWSGTPGPAGAWAVGALASLGFFLAPAAAEEAIFRGYPFQVLARAVGPMVAVAATSLAFGALHLGNPGADAVAALNVTLAGALLGAVYLRTGSLWWATGVHLGWNWAHGYLADLPVSGLDLVDAPGVTAASGTPDWLSGGPFGPEGSVLTAGVTAAATVWVWRTDRLQVPAVVRRTEPIAPLIERGSAADGPPDGVGEEPDDEVEDQMDPDGRRAGRVTTYGDDATHDIPYRESRREEADDVG